MQKYLEEQLTYLTNHKDNLEEYSDFVLKHFDQLKNFKEIKTEERFLNDEEKKSKEDINTYLSETHYFSLITPKVKYFGNKLNKFIYIQQRKRIVERFVKDFKMFMDGSKITKENLTLEIIRQYLKKNKITAKYNSLIWHIYSYIIHNDFLLPIPKQTYERIYKEMIVYLKWFCEKKMNYSFSEKYNSSINFFVLLEFLFNKLPKSEKDLIDKNFLSFIELQAYNISSYQKNLELLKLCSV